MKNCGHHNVRKYKEIKSSDRYVTLKKHKEIRGSDKYVTLDVSSKFDSLNRMKITSSESKVKSGKIRKGVDYLSGFQDQNKVAKIHKRKGMQ